MRPAQGGQWAQPYLSLFQPHDTAEFTLEPQGSATHVNWSMFGPNRFVGKVKSIFVNVDRMVGGQFDQGLANMKAVLKTRRKTWGSGGPLALRACAGLFNGSDDSAAGLAIARRNTCSARFARAAGR